MQAVSIILLKKWFYSAVKKKKKSEDEGGSSHSLVANHNTENTHTRVSGARQTPIQLPPAPFTSSVILDK